MTIEYVPKMLESVSNSIFAEKRLKNREGQATCDCGWFFCGFILKVISTAKQHDKAGHNITITEISCRNSLISY